jgi:hypothetical protein
MSTYVNNSIELRKHLNNAVQYMEKDTTNFPLHETTAFIKGFLEGLAEIDKLNYDAWLKDQKDNAEV